MMVLVHLPAIFVVACGIWIFVASRMAETPFWLKSIYVTLAAVAPLLVLGIVSLAWNATDCFGGRVFEGCETTSESYGRRLYITMWLSTLSALPALIAGIGVVATASAVKVFHLYYAGRK